MYNKVMHIIFVTGNKNKLREAEGILGITLDSFDMNMIIHKKISDNITVHPNNYYFLTDPNNEFLHDDDVPRWIQTDVEIELRKNKLIL